MRSNAIRFVASKGPHTDKVIKLRIVRNSVGEHEVRVAIDGIPQPLRTYFTDDRTDAEGTMRAMRAELER